MDSARLQEVLSWVAANVVRLRRRRGLTQEALAERAGVEVRTVQAIERGRTNVSVRYLLAFADALGVDMRQLLKPARLAPARPGRPKKAKPKAAVRRR